MFRKLSRYSDGLRTGRPRNSGSFPGGGKNFSLPHSVQTGSEALPAKRPGREPGHSPFSAEAKNVLSYTRISIAPLRLHGTWTLYLYLDRVYVTTEPTGFHSVVLRFPSRCSEICNYNTLCRLTTHTLFALLQLTNI
jgi:hypothetical protein